MNIPCYICAASSGFELYPAPVMRRLELYQRNEDWGARSRNSALCIIARAIGII
jgi:hypothetical protein